MECDMEWRGGDQEYLWCVTHAAAIIFFPANSWPYRIDWKKVREAIEKHKREYLAV
jgi:hypothetical protein